MCFGRQIKVKGVHSQIKSSLKLRLRLVLIAYNGVIRDRPMTPFHFRIIRGTSWANKDMLNPQSNQPQCKEGGKVIGLSGCRQTRLIVGLDTLWQGIPEGETTSQRVTSLFESNLARALTCFSSIMQHCANTSSTKWISDGVQIHLATILQNNSHLEIHLPALMHFFRLAWTLALDTLDGSASKSFPLIQVASNLRQTWKSQTVQCLTLSCHVSNALRSPMGMF
jgi:hypothetical protein